LLWGKSLLFICRKRSGSTHCTDTCAILKEESCPVAVGEVLTHQLLIEVREYTLYSTDACTSLIEGSCPVSVGEVITRQLLVEVREYTLYRHLYQPHRGIMSCCSGGGPYSYASTADRGKEVQKVQRLYLSKNKDDI
jgi:hypothetical protein